MTDKRKTPDVVDATEAHRQSRAAAPNDLGRAFALEGIPEDHLRMIEKAAADLSSETPSEIAPQRIAADPARNAGPNRAMTKEEIDAMWGHDAEPNAETPGETAQLDPEDAALFEMFEREGWSRERQNEHMARLIAASIAADYTPGPETIAAMIEARKGGLEQFSSIADLMTDLNDDSTGEQAQIAEKIMSDDAAILRDLAKK